jgi:hypothetical protein
MWNHVYIYYGNCGLAWRGYWGSKGHIFYFKKDDMTKEQPQIWLLRRVCGRMLGKLYTFHACIVFLVISMRSVISIAAADKNPERALVSSSTIRPDI